MYILFNFTQMRVFLAICVVLFCNMHSFGRNSGEAFLYKETTGYVANQPGKIKPNPRVLNFFKKQNSRKRTIASALAFPLPFGFLGIHRIYLGTKPYIPLIYVGTLGGCAGILPLIDFVNLVSHKDISNYQANPRIFMWVDNEKKK